MPTATIEPLTGVIRVFPDGKHYGDQYEYVATVRWVDRVTAEVLGVMESPTLPQVRAMCKALYCQGVTQVYWTRLRNGKKRIVKIDTLAGMSRIIPAAAKEDQCDEAEGCCAVSDGP